MFLPLGRSYRPRLQEIKATTRHCEGRARNVTYSIAMVKIMEIYLPVKPIRIYVSTDGAGPEPHVHAVECKVVRRQRNMNREYRIRRTGRHICCTAGQRYSPNDLLLCSTTDNVHKHEILLLRTRFQQGHTMVGAPSDWGSRYRVS